MGKRVFTWSDGTKVTSADVRRRPGSPSNECGSEITKGGHLALSFMYATGTPSVALQLETFQAVATSVGIVITLDGQAESAMFSNGGVCPSSPPCNLGLLADSDFTWDLGQYELLPVGGNELGTRVARPCHPGQPRLLRQAQ